MAIMLSLRCFSPSAKLIQIFKCAVISVPVVFFDYSNYSLRKNMPLNECAQCEQPQQSKKCVHYYSLVEL